MTQEQQNYLKEALIRAREIEIKCNTILAKAYYQTELYKLTAHKRKLAIECAEYIERISYNGQTKHEYLISKQKSLL
jgi:hypothetical protein